MSRRDELNDALDSILGDRGSSASVDPQLDRMVRGLKAAFPAPVISAAVSSRHLAAIGLASQGSPTASAPAGVMDRIRQQMHSRIAKVAASALALLGSFSGLAVAGVLPDAVQESVADVAAWVGINLPRPDSVTASTEDSDGRRDEDETSGPAEEPEPSADGATADGRGSTPDDDKTGGADGDSDPDDQRHDGEGSDDDDSDDEDRSGSGDRDSGDRDSDGGDSDDDDSSGSKGDGRYSGDRDRDGDDSDDSHTGGDSGGSGDDAVDIDGADSDDPDKGDSASDAEDLEVPDVGDGDDD